MPRRRSLRSIVGETKPRPVILGPRTVRARHVDFGSGSFIEVARKRIGPRGDTTDFLVIARGYYADSARKREPRSRRIVTMPNLPKVRQQVALWLQTL